jgi:hypothetical protein
VCQFRELEAIERSHEDTDSDMLATYAPTCAVMLQVTSFVRARDQLQLLLQLIVEPSGATVDDAAGAVRHH